MGQYKSQYTGPQIDAGINAALNPDVAVTPDSDALVTSGAVADALDNIDPTITSDTDTTLNGILVGNGSKVGTKSLDTSGLTNDADHVPTSGVVKSALNTVDESIAIRVSGNKTTYASGAAIGQYVIVDGSTIAGITDGMYKAAKAIPYNTGIDSTYLTAVSGGGLNDLKSAIKPLGNLCCSQYFNSGASGGDRLFKFEDNNHIHAFIVGRQSTSPIVDYVVITANGVSITHLAATVITTITNPNEGEIIITFPSWTVYEVISPNSFT